MYFTKQIFETNLHRLVQTLAAGDSASIVELDFSRVRFYIPGATVAIIAKIKNWEQNGIPWSFVNYDLNPNLRYFQRIDFFNVLGFDLPENFMRHDEARRFVSIEKVPSADQDVSPLAARIAGCIVTDSEEATRLLEFANGEAMLNARQHSGGEGFVAAQFTPSNETARIGVSDCGIGIRESFRRNESPHFRAEMSDLDILLKALEPEISSTTHKRTLYGRSPNRGVGLSMMRNLMSQTLGGMALISGSAWWNQTASNPPTFGEFPDGVYFNGTICALAFRRDQITSHFKMLEQARIKLGLQTDGSLDSMFT